MTHLGLAASAVVRDAGRMSEGLFPNGHLDAPGVGD